MRGSLLLIVFLDFFLGIIPAHAGLTCPSPKIFYRRRDHPRACGAHVDCRVGQPGFAGSSPRMRGSLCQWEGLERRTGIIPAHAGLTHADRHEPSHLRDHPRACGAHQGKHGTDRDIVGSSPRMRGSRDLAFQQPEAVGIIPAHAGLTTSASRMSFITGDHPRACGAHTNTFEMPPFFVGSSPRMRGSQRRAREP